MRRDRVQRVFTRARELTDTPPSTFSVPFDYFLARATPHRRLRTAAPFVRAGCAFVSFLPFPPPPFFLFLSSFPFPPFILYYDFLDIICPRQRAWRDRRRRSIREVVSRSYWRTETATDRRSIVADREEAIEGRGINAMLWGSVTSTAADPSLGINIISCSKAKLCTELIYYYCYLLYCITDCY